MKWQRKLLAFKFLEDVSHELIISIRLCVLLHDTKHMKANTIKVKIDLVAMLLESLFLEPLNFKIHVNFIVRSNAIEDDCKNGKTIHLLIFSVRSNPSVQLLKLFNCLRAVGVSNDSCTTSPVGDGLRLRLAGVIANPFAIVIYLIS